METKKKHDVPLEYLTEEQLDDFLEYTQPFSEENLQAISRRFEEKTGNTSIKKLSNTKKWQKGLIFAAAALVLLLVGFTQLGTLKRTYYQLFGSDADKLLLNTDKLDASVEDQGLRLTAVSAFKDGGTTYFLSELTDLTGDRLDGETMIDRWQMNGGGNSRVINYDEKTKTATILTTAIATFDGSASTPGFLLESILSGRWEKQTMSPVKLSDHINQQAAWIDISKQDGQGGGSDPVLMEKYNLTWDELNKVGLKPLEMNVVLDEEQEVVLTNAAYKDDFLHVQIKYPNHIKREYAFIVLINRKTGEEKHSMASFQVDEGTHNNQTGRTDYEELIFDISAEQLSEYDVRIDGMGHEIQQSGEWAIKLAEPQALPTTDLQDADVVVDGKKIKLKNIKLSPLSLSFECTVDMSESYDSDWQINIQMKDGTTLDYLKDGMMTSGSEGKKTSIQVSGSYLELENIEKVSINGTELSKK
ncbi:hypothetical protein ACYSNR_12485 [Enterococcus sp. LJL128]